MLTNRLDYNSAVFKQLIGSNRNDQYLSNPVAVITMLHDAIVKKDEPFPECGGYTPIKTYVRIPVGTTEPPDGVTVDDSYTIKEISATNFEGYERRKTLEDFIKKQVFDNCYGSKLTIKIFVNESRGSTVVVHNSKRYTASAIVWNCLASFITIICPWIFEENPANKDLLELCKVIVDNESGSSVDEVLAAVAKKYAKKPKQVSIFELMAKKNFDARKKQLEDKITDHNNNLNFHMQKYMLELEDLNKDSEELSNLKYVPGTKTELDEYLESNDNIEAKADEFNASILIKVNGFMNVDPDAAEQCLNNNPPWLNGGYGSAIQDTYWNLRTRKEFIRLLFVDRVAQCKVQSGYTWHLEGANNSVRVNAEGWPLDEGYIYNCHHKLTV